MVNGIDPTGTESACGLVKGCAAPKPPSETEVAIANTVADFTPVVGDIKGIVEAINDPSAINVTAAVVGIVPGVGDAVATGLKAGRNLAEGAADAAKGGPDFVVTPKGEAIPVPDGASGPNPTRASGMMYEGGSGGKGMNERVSSVRIMDGNSNQGPRAVYMNGAGQKVDPSTGRTVSNASPQAHQYLEPWNE